ncbi:hypothetical protein SAMN05444166_1688 [Singulisphaera sp. GP187]|uniref:hypothetical protein n=1 Tax=Singulisphaera sp. GP187 TaxID=1882752 RepID=UPI000929A40E|nr:hypothetical protein [Singulisphaera sp. GP187]SIN93585.1 hypothetical protein SAMN05444166_1688 [Singulisphaera sp. GP187]
MKKFRISVGGLMAVVLVLALGIAALRSASEIVGSLTPEFAEELPNPIRESPAHW